MTVGDLKKSIPELLHRVEELHEFNPMLGHRGCRLGITYPEITEMQARAIFEAAVQVAKKGIKVIPEVMIPLIGGVQELEHQKAIVVRVAEEVLGKAGMKKLHYLVGTMIEIPRAALTADKVAEEAEFFSFGTNDLTQTTMGLSRDDYTKFSKHYEDLKIFKADPFAVARSGRRGQADRDGRRAGPQHAAGSGSRHLRRARRRAELGGVLLPRGHELRFVLALPRADRAAGGGAGGDGRQDGDDADRVVWEVSCRLLGGRAQFACGLYVFLGRLVGLVPLGRFLRFGRKLHELECRAPTSTSWPCWCSRFCPQCRRLCGSRGSRRRHKGCVQGFRDRPGPGCRSAQRSGRWSRVLPHADAREFSRDRQVSRGNWKSRSPS